MRRGAAGCVVGDSPRVGENDERGSFQTRGGVGGGLRRCVDTLTRVNSCQCRRWRVVGVESDGGVGGDEKESGGSGGMRRAPQDRRPTRRPDAQARVLYAWLGRSHARSVPRRTDQAQGGGVGGRARGSRRRQEYTLVGVGGGVLRSSHRQEYTLVGGEAGGRRAATGQAMSRSSAAGATTATPSAEDQSPRLACWSRGLGARIVGP